MIEGTHYHIFLYGSPSSSATSTTPARVRLPLTRGTQGGLLWKMSLLRRSTVGFLEAFVRGCKNPKKSQYSKRSQIGLYAGKDIRCVSSARRLAQAVVVVACSVRRKQVLRSRTCL